MPFLVTRVFALLDENGQPHNVDTEALPEEHATLATAAREADLRARGELQKPDLEADSWVVVVAGAATFNPVYQGRAF